MNLGTAKTKALMLIDVYSKNGTIQDPNGTKLKNYTYKMAPFFDMAQKQVATIKKIVKKKPISHNMPLNKLPQSSLQFDIVAFTGVDQNYEVIGAKSYYFEVDDVATVYIEESISDVWTVKATINNALINAGQFTAYKGLITPDDVTNKIRIRFSGTTRYNHRNRALFTDAFSDITRVPDYKQHVLYSMPDDFYEFKRLVLKGQSVNSQEYQNTSEFYWEEGNKLALKYDSVGEYIAEYHAYPTTINNADASLGIIATPDTYEFEVSTEAQESLPIFVASQLLLNENNAIGDRLLAQYNNILVNLNTNTTTNTGTVTNSLFSDSGISNKYM